MRVLEFLREQIRVLNLEEVFVHWRKRANIIRYFIPRQYRSKFSSVGRLIPYSSQYPLNDQYRMVRDKTNFIVNRSDYVQWRLFYGVRDQALIHARKFLRKNSLVIDIGSNVGAFSLRLATSALLCGVDDLKILAFEPNHNIYALFQKNLGLNPHLSPIIQSHNVGLGKEHNRVHFKVDGFNSGAGRITSSSKELTVEVHSLDTIIESLNRPSICFIKLIVEGYEPLVLQGAQKTISRFKPPIFIEVTPRWWKEHGFEVDAVLDNLRMLGYEFKIEHENEMFDYVPARYEHRTQFNLMAAVR